MQLQDVMVEGCCRTARLLKRCTLTSGFLSCDCWKSMPTSSSAAGNMASVSCMTLFLHNMQAGSMQAGSNSKVSPQCSVWFHTLFGHSGKPSGKAGHGVCHLLKQYCRHKLKLASTCAATGLDLQTTSDSPRPGCMPPAT